MTFLEYTFLHMAISLVLLGWCFWVNRQVQWVEGGMITAMITASIIAFVVVIALSVVDLVGFF